MPACLIASGCECDSKGRAMVLAGSGLWVWFDRGRVRACLCSSSSNGIATVAETISSSPVERNLNTLGATRTGLAIRKPSLHCPHASRRSTAELRMDVKYGRTVLDDSLEPRENKYGAGSYRPYSFLISSLTYNYLCELYAPVGTASNRAVDLHARASTWCGVSSAVIDRP